MAGPIRMRAATTWIAALALVLCIFVPVSAATVGNKVASSSEQAAQAYSSGNFEEALRLYRDAQLEDPDSPALHYNVGDALYKLEQYEAAVEEFKRVTVEEAANLGAQSWYNLGNTLFQQQQYAPAAEAFKNALLQNSLDHEAKSNLEMALEYLEQQEQQQQQSSEAGDSDEEHSDDSAQQQSSPQQQQQSEENQTQQQSADNEEAPAEPEAAEEEAAPEDPLDDPVDQGINEQVGDEQTENMDEQEAEQLLDALRDREVEAQRRRFRYVPRGQTHDW